MQGDDKFLQESFVDFKKIWLSAAEKDPAVGVLTFFKQDLPVSGEQTGDGLIVIDEVNGLRKHMGGGDVLDLGVRLDALLGGDGI